jgi:hypothetical protein
MITSIKLLCENPTIIDILLTKPTFEERWRETVPLGLLREATA